MLGSATFTIVLSSTTMNCARQAITKISQRFEDEDSVLKSEPPGEGWREKERDEEPELDSSFRLA
jgi:hypothetical protein